MRTEQLKQFIIKYYMTGSIGDYRPSLMIFGPPGIGKSVSVREAGMEIAKRLGKEFVEYSDDIAPEILKNPDKYFVFNDLRLTEVEPSDLIGVPRDMNGYITYKPLLWARVMSKTAGILFLDELTNITRPDVKSITYKLLLDRKAGYIKFHKDVLVISAGNSTEHSSIAEGFTAPQANRMIIIHLNPPTIDEWAEWNNRTFGEDGWDKRTYAFLKAFEMDGYLLQIPRDPLVENNFPTPRSWSILSVLLKKGITEGEIIEGLLGQEVGSKFKAFMKIHVDLNTLIKKPEQWNELEIDGKYMALLMLSTWITKNIKKVNTVFKLIDTITEDSHEYLIFLIKTMNKGARVKFMHKLFNYNVKYRKILSEIVIELADKIRA